MAMALLLTMVNKGLSYFKVFSFIGSVFFFSCSPQRQLLYNIELQDGFNNDIVSMKLSECQIFDGVDVTTGRILGTTNVNILIFKKNDKYEIDYGGRKSSCKTKNQSNQDLQLLINKSLHAIRLSDLNKKYIGISKNQLDSLFILQSDNPFMHD